jgi:hypothetical protein
VGDSAEQSTRREDSEKNNSDAIITRVASAYGWQVNENRIYRIWRREDLKSPEKKTKR